MITKTNFIAPYHKKGNDVTNKDLESFIGKQVTIWIGQGTRNSFSSQISVSGKLEQDGSNNNKYRVFISTGIYSYFLFVDIIEIGTHGSGQTFKDGSMAVIRLTILQ